MDRAGPETIDEYIAGFPPDIQARLEKVRAAIKNAAPDAEETIKYRIPTFTLKGNLISFAAYKKHIGLYPAPTGSKKFNQELAPYRAEKSSIRFPLDEPMPFDLMREIVVFRVQENRAKGTR